MRSIYIVFAACIVGFTACNDAATTTQSTANTPKEPTKSKLGDAGTAKLMNVLGKYYSLKNALVATKAIDAGAASVQLSVEADSMLAYLGADSVNRPALKPYLDTIINYSRAISTTEDVTCEKQRISFEYVSRSFYGLLKNVDLKNGHVYHQYCPMAFNDKGAFWLSDDNEIKNPYFGKKMLECGETTDSL